MATGADATLAGTGSTSAVSVKGGGGTIVIAARETVATWAATVTLELSFDGTNWLATSTTVTNEGVAVLQMKTESEIMARATVSSHTTGTAQVSIRT